MYVLYFIFKFIVILTSEVAHPTQRVSALRFKPVSSMGMAGVLKETRL